MSLVPSFIQISSAPPIGDRTSRLLVVEQDPGALDRIHEMLENEGYETQELSDPDEVFDVIETFDPDLILLNAQLTGDDFDLCRDIRTADVMRHTPIMLFDWSAQDDEFVSSALRAGADEFFLQMERRQEFLARVAVQVRNKHYWDALRRLRTERDNLRRDVQLDGLTQVLSRRSLEVALANLHAKAENFAVLFLDVDRFKDVNDNYGHESGDVVLHKTAERLRQGIRSGDCVGRWGGEEFMLLLPGATVDTAYSVATRHRLNIAKLELPEGCPKTVTVSIGVSVFDPLSDEGPDGLVRRADSALYQAKMLGRNCVVQSPNYRAPLRTLADSKAERATSAQK